MNLTLNIQKNTAQRLQKVLAQVDNQEVFVQNFIDFQRYELKKSLVLLGNDLNDFEKKYQKSSKAFYHDFQQGLLSDDEDYLLWSGIYEMWLENKNKLKVLE